MIDEIYNCDCIDGMRELPADSVDAIVTDPPYGLSFMGKEWDHGVPGEQFWVEALRVAKPGAHLLAFGGTRTYHRLACAIEDAGWEVRDCLGWLYGSGFPKGMDVSKAIDKRLGVERKIVGFSVQQQQRTPAIATSVYGDYKGQSGDITSPASEAAKQWQGWGTCLKPAWEPIIMARKPIKGTVAACVLEHGTGAINIDACRVGTDTMINQPAGNKAGGNSLNMSVKGMPENVDPTVSHGRFPANIIHDGSEEVLAVFPETGKSRKSFNVNRKDTENIAMSGRNYARHTDEEGYDDSGSAARFFYCAKASKKDRNSGCERLLTWENVDLSHETGELNRLAKDISDDTMRELESIEWSTISFGKTTTSQFRKECRFIISTVTKLIIELRTCNSSPLLNTKDFILDACKMLTERGINLVPYVENLSQSIPDSIEGKTESVRSVVLAALSVLLRISEKGKLGNIHSTVKPQALMQYLIRLVTQEGAIVLDPFLGSGSTAVAAVSIGRHYIGYELSPEYFDIARARIEAASIEMT